MDFKSQYLIKARFLIFSLFTERVIFFTKKCKKFTSSSLLRALKTKRKGLGLQNLVYTPKNNGKMCDQIFINLRHL